VIVGSLWDTRSHLVTWQVWRALAASRDVPPLFAGTPHQPAANLWWALGSVLLLAGGLVFFPVLIPLYTGLLGYAALHRTRTFIHQLNRQHAYDLLAVSSLGPLGATWACFAAWFHRDPGTVRAWQVYIAVMAFMSPFVILWGLAQTVSGGVMAVALPFLCGIAYVYLEVFLSVSLGGLVALLSAAYGLTRTTRIVAEAGYVAFKLVTYALEFAGGYAVLTLIPWTWAVGPAALLLLVGYLALYEWLHRRLWQQLTAQTQETDLHPRQLVRW
jgi:hypothetical protein